MKFSTRAEIEAPMAHVFAKLSDFSAFERRALRHGVQVTRCADGPVAVGTQWEIVFKLRGRERRMRATLAALDVPEMYRFDAVSDGLNVQSAVELIALSPKRTRLVVSVDLRPRSLTARVLLQSMKLAKTKLNKRFKARVLEYAGDIEDDYRRST